MLLTRTDWLVPTIAYFLGIAVAMYHRDHNPPHIHVLYAGYEALIAIDDARVFARKIAADRHACFTKMGDLAARSVACKLAAGAEA